MPERPTLARRLTVAGVVLANVMFGKPAVFLRPADVPGFVAAQLLGAGAATLLFAWLVPDLPAAAGDVVVPHPTGGEADAG